MMLRYFSLTILLLLSLTLCATSYDLNRPFGFCTRTSRTSTDSQYAFNVTGGGCYQYPLKGTGNSKIVFLTSTGRDMKQEIADAIANYDIIIFDGAKGDFIISTIITLNNLSNKTLLGINHARLCTEWYATPELIAALNAADVPHLSTQRGTGDTLSNGHYVGEQAEYKTRQIIIDMTGDLKERYRDAGIFLFYGCRNLIIRNLTFQGPGSIDVGGSDLLSFRNTKNSWVDHCDFSDGMDGNFDITQRSDFNTVSWCTFSYTERSYMHQNTNLIGYSDSEPEGYLNTTFAFNHWGKNCLQRMPMGRIGKVHMLNNYFSSTGCSACVNPRIHSEFLIEGNYFDKGVKRYYSQHQADAVTWRDNNFIAEAKKQAIPPSMGAEVSMPYSYSVADCNDIPQQVATHAGATLLW